ncbi:hypothetical protein J4421_01975 [Candidatus Woesearchaeota archaeon]|nr:hypothetical protein [Candidatus Woesearchaeota archaeon]
MVNPEFIQEQPLSLAGAKKVLTEIEKRDNELNYRSNRAKEFFEQFPILSLEKKDELYKKITSLNLTRLKEEHLMKILDFLPKTTEELKIVLQAYPLSMPKKDQEAIVEVVKEVHPNK